MIFASFIFFAVITLIAPILGKYIAWVFKYNLNEHESLKYNHGHWKSQNWKEYFSSLMCFNTVCIVCTFIIIYFQEYFPTYIEGQHKISLSSSINAAISFSTGTFWQSHNPETDLSLLVHVFALTMQNFLSGATGIAVFIAFIRGIINSQNPYIGNFYDDFLRSMIYILLPISIIIAITLISQGIPYDFTGAIQYTDLVSNSNHMNIGPVAGQVAIKNLVANGGSLFASASAHPFEAPSREVIMLRHCNKIT